MIESVQLLDCTLRDGGYINNWQFGEDAMRDILTRLTAAGMDIVEIGFLRDEEDAPGRAVFSSVEGAEALLGDVPRGKSVYCAMCEALNPLPAERISPRSGNGLDLIRVIVWQRLLDANFEFCRKIRAKGYELCVQPNRIDSYSEADFRSLIRRFNVLKPLALYVVDSFGVLCSEELMAYVRIADEELWPGGAIGYHGHNNMQQAFETAQRILRADIPRRLLLDGSVYGIGRGAGNLATELIAEHLNRHFSGRYGMEEILEIYDRYIRPIYAREKWGYLPCYYLTARHRCNPMYGDFYGLRLGLDAAVINRILGRLTPEDKIRFTREKAIAYARAEGLCVEE